MKILDIVSYIRIIFNIIMNIVQNSDSMISGSLLQFKLSSHTHKTVILNLMTLNSFLSVANSASLKKMLRNFAKIFFFSLTVLVFKVYNRRQYIISFQVFGTVLRNEYRNSLISTRRCWNSKFFLIC